MNTVTSIVPGSDQFILDGALFEYTDQTHDSMLSDLQRQLGIPPDAEQLRIPSYLGEGKISNYELEQDLFIRYLDFRVQYDFPFYRRKGDPSKPYFHLYYFLDKSGFHFNLESEPIRPDAFGNIIFMSNDIEIKGVFKAGSLVKAICLIFSKEWMIRQCAGISEQVDQFCKEQKDKIKPFFLLNPVDSGEFAIAGQVHKAVEKGSGTNLSTRIKCMNLINGFFSSFSDRKYLYHARTQSAHFMEIVKIENRIMQCLDASLPSLKELAKEFNIGINTMKRHFKVVYGHSIYEYYLQRKMEKAKEMITKKGLQVAEVAYFLGYEKPGSLTAEFKKIFGVLPSSLKSSRLGFTG